MIRRTKAGDGFPQAPTSGGIKSPLSRSNSRKTHEPHFSRMSTPTLITLGCVLLVGSLMMLSIMSPESVHTGEEFLYQVEGMVEHEVNGMYDGMFGNTDRVPPPKQMDPPPRARSRDATAAMLKQDSSWVDGEKKLKAKLKILAQRQAEGKDLGVPVLTRWLGEDIPAWAGEGVDVEDWKKKVEAKYAEMREQEEKWRLEVAQFIEEGKTIQ
jgi:hypothetical protein